MGFTHVTHLAHMTCFMSYDWFWYVAQLTHRSQLMDFTLWLAMSHESCDAEYESHRVRDRGGLRVYKAASGRSVVRSSHNHLSTILPTIPLYDFPSLLQYMRKMLYERTQSSRLLYTTSAGAYRSSPIEPLRSRIVTTNHASCSARDILPSSGDESLYEEQPPYHFRYSCIWDRNW